MEGESRIAELERLARIGSWEWDLQTDAVKWSDELWRIYGLEIGSVELSYENFLARVHPDDRASVDERNRRCFDTHEPFEDVKRIVRPDGSEFLMRTRGEMVVSADGVPLRMVGVCDDVTTAIQESRHRAVEINHTVMQSLVLARYHLVTDREQAERALDQAIEQAQSLVDELLGPADAPLAPGSLRF